MPRTAFRPGRCLPMSFGHSRSVEGKNFKQIVFAVLLSEEQSRPVSP